MKEFEEYRKMKVLQNGQQLVKWQFGKHLKKEKSFAKIILISLF